MLAEYGAAIGGWAGTLGAMGGPGGGSNMLLGLGVFGVSAALLLWFLAR